jgi:hypothetical protein
MMQSEWGPATARLGTCLALALALGCWKKTEGGSGAGADEAQEPPPIAAPFVEDFASGRVDPARWNATSSGYSVVDGALLARNARNHPLWLRPPLPCDVQLELTTWSDSPDGDIKIEVMGDGASFDPDQGAYTSSAYVFVFGGWRNSLSTIARMDEHRARMTVDEQTRVEPGRKYRWTIRFAGGTIDWSIDGRPFLHAEDPEPLCGPGHHHFAVDDWAVPVHFDDLTITPLGAPATS